MSNAQLSNDLLRRVGPLAAQRYATKHGWVRVALPKQYRVSLYRLESDPEKELIIPQDTTVDDYVARIADFVEAIAAAEGRPAGQVLTTLVSPSSDVVRFGYKSPDTRLGTIPLPDGMSLYEAALRAISSTTYDIIHPEPFHARMSNPEADAFIKSCRMGQTEYSSFVISCICPVEPDSQLHLQAESGDESLFDTPAFGRKVTERLMAALGQINSLVLADQADRLVNPEPDDLRISGNFFEALLGFPLMNEETSLLITTNWDVSIPFPSVQDKADLRYDLFPTLEDVARQLRPSRTAAEGRFVAKVVALRGNLNPQNEMEGDAVLNLLDDESSFRAKIWLNSADYSLACDAHKLNQPIAVSGTLVRGRKASRFEDYSNFHAVSLG